MEARFGRHYSADLYLCQNKLWENRNQLENAMDKISTYLDKDQLSWRFECFKTTIIRIIGAINEFNLMIIQIFPGENFLALDLFGWQSQLDLQLFSEELINIFAPQVVAADTKLRAEHIDSRPR